MKYKVLVIDLDNTLLDFDVMEKESFIKTLDENCIPYGLDFFDDYKNINTKLWQDLEKGLIGKKELRKRRFEILFNKHNIEFSADKFNDLFIEKIKEKPVFIDGAIEFLNYVKDNYINILITNGFSDTQREKLKKLDISKYFDHIIISDEVGLAKPDLKIYEYMNSLVGNIDKTKILAIGDSLTSDIKGGIDYGIDTLWFNKRSEDKKSNATYEATNLKEVMSLLRRV